MSKQESVWNQLAAKVTGCSVCGGAIREDELRMIMDTQDPDATGPGVRMEAICTKCRRAAHKREKGGHP